MKTTEEQLKATEELILRLINEQKSLRHSVVNAFILVFYILISYFIIIFSSFFVSIPYLKWVAIFIIIERGYSILKTYYKLSKELI